LGSDLGPDSESAGGGAVVGAGRDEEFKNQTIIFVGVEALGSQIDFDPAESGIGEDNGITEN